MLNTNDYNAMDLAQPTNFRAMLRSGELLWGTSCRILSEDAARVVATLPHHFCFIDSVRIHSISIRDLDTSTVWLNSNSGSLDAGAFTTQRHPTGQPDQNHPTILEWQHGTLCSHYTGLDQPD